MIKPFAKLKVDKKNRVLLVKELRQLDRERITAGIHASDGSQIVSKNGFRLIDVAVQNEYGNKWTLNESVSFYKNGQWWHLPKGKTIKIPATNFVGRLIKDLGERRTLIDAVKSELHLVINYPKQYKIINAIRSVGEYMVNRIRYGIDKKMFQDNSPMTIAIKGFNKRLYEKGFLYNSVKFRSKKARVKS